MDDEELIEYCYNLIRDYVYLYRADTQTDIAREAQTEALDTLEQELIEHLIEAQERGYNLPDYNECRYLIEIETDEQELKSYFDEHLS